MSGQGENPPTLEEQLAAASARADAAEAKLAEIEPKLVDLEQALVELAAAEDGDVTRYAVFDTRYEKFVGQVTTDRPSASEAKKLVGHDDVEIRKV